MIAERKSRHIRKAVGKGGASGRTHRLLGRGCLADLMSWCLLTPPPILYLVFFTDFFPKIKKKKW